MSTFMKSPNTIVSMHPTFFGLSSHSLTALMAISDAMSLGKPKMPVLMQQKAMDLIPLATARSRQLM